MSKAKLKKFIASFISVLYATSCFGANASTEFDPDFMTKKVEQAEKLQNMDPKLRVCPMNRFFVDPCVRLLLKKGISEGYVELSPVFKDLYKLCDVDELCQSGSVIGLYDFLTFFIGFYEFCGKIEDYDSTMKVEEIVKIFESEGGNEYIIAKFDDSNDAYLLRYIRLKPINDYWGENQRFFSTTESIGETDCLCHNLHFLEDSDETFDPSIGADFGLFHKKTKDLRGCYTIVDKLGVYTFKEWDKLKLFLENHPDYILVNCANVSNNAGYYFFCAKYTGRANQGIKYHFSFK